MEECKSVLRGVLSAISSCLSQGLKGKELVEGHGIVDKHGFGQGCNFVSLSSLLLFLLLLSNYVCAIFISSVYPYLPYLLFPFFFFLSFVSFPSGVCMLMMMAEKANEIWVVFIGLNHLLLMLHTSWVFACILI